LALFYQLLTRKQNIRTSTLFTNNKTHSLRAIHVAWQRGNAPA